LTKSRHDGKRKATERRKIPEISERGGEKGKLKRCRLKKKKRGYVKRGEVRKGKERKRDAEHEPVLFEGPILVQPRGKGARKKTAPQSEYAEKDEATMMRKRKVRRRQRAEKKRTPPSSGRGAESPRGEKKGIGRGTIGGRKLNTVLEGGEFAGRKEMNSPSGRRRRRLSNLL